MISLFVSVQTLSIISYRKKCVYEISLDAGQGPIFYENHVGLISFIAHEVSKPGLFCHLRRVFRCQVYIFIQRN